MKKLNKKGFTLVELLLVIAIIGILAAVLFVSLGKQRERARMTTFKENMRSMVAASTACHDGGGVVLTASGGGSVNADGVGDVCVPDQGIGVIPEITQCVGGTDLVSLTVANGDVDGWSITGSCTKSDATTCDASCAMEGCHFANCE